VLYISIDNLDIIWLQYKQICVLNQFMSRFVNLYTCTCRRYMYINYKKYIITYWCIYREYLI